MQPKATDAQVTGQHGLKHAERDELAVRQGQYKNSDWQRELIRSIAGELEPRLVFSTLRREVGYVGIEPVCKATSASREQFEEWCKQVQMLVDEIVACAIELEEVNVPDETIAEERAKLKQELLQGVVFPSPPDPIVDYKFADLVPEQALQSATRILRDECVRFASDFVSLLLTLQEKLIVGSIEHTRTSCKAEFYRHRVVFEALETRLRSYPSQMPSNSRALNRVDVYREQSFKVTTSTISHVHHVHHPVRRKVGSEKYPIPVQFVPILASLPDWMAPSMRILEGTQINEIQRQKRSSEHTSFGRQYVSSRWQLEPAILIGNFVLAGWNEKEIELEQRRRDQCFSEPHLRQQKIASRVWLVVAGILGAASIACMAYSALSQSLALLALLFGTGAVYAGSCGCALNHKAEQGDYLARLLVIAETTFFPLAVIYGVANRSVPATVLGTLGILIAAATLWGHRVVHAVREEFGE